jgi:hypothetical protein
MKEKCLYCLDTGCEYCTPKGTTGNKSASVRGYAPFKQLTEEENKRLYEISEKDDNAITRKELLEFMQLNHKIMKGMMLE